MVNVNTSLKGWCHPDRDVVGSLWEWGSGLCGVMEWTPWSQRRWLGRPWTHMAVEWSQAVSPSPCMMKQAAIHIWLSVPHCPSPISLRRLNIKHVKSKPLMTEFKVCSIRRLWSFFACVRQALSQRDAPHRNFFFFDGLKGSGVVDYFGSK